MIRHEPELQHLERACRDCRRDGGGWYDFWSANVVEITRLVGPVARCSALRSDKAFKVAHTHFIQVWIDSLGETRTGPWDAQRTATAGTEQLELFEQQPVEGHR